MKATVISPEPPTCAICQDKKGSHSRDHTFRAKMRPPVPGVLMDCGCGLMVKTAEKVTDLAEMHNILRELRWRHIDGAWKCPKCGQNYDAAQTRKREKQGIKAR